MKILVLGGTGYIGPHLVAHALSRGQQLTLFNRGRTKPGLFPGIEKLIGDRNEATGHEALRRRTWDVVHDLPPTKPQWIVNAAVLKGRVAQCVYVSSTAAYKEFTHAFPDETHPTQDPAPISGPEAAAAPYGNRKVRCEQLVQDAFGSGATVVRPGLIVGPGDLTDRFTYRPARIEKGGEIPAPGSISDPAQWIDVRDLTEWMVRFGENRTGGLTEQQVRSWGEMSVWSYGGASTAAFSTSVIEKALSAGLTFRSLATTVRGGMAWYHARPAAEQERLRAGISPEREQEVLALWHLQQGGGA